MLAVKLCLLFFSLVIVSGCESMRYYSQAVAGQLSLISKRQDINDVINDNKTDALLKQRLQQVQNMRLFAEKTLLLPVGDSYSSYVDIERDYVVWNVYAAQELSLKPKTWCFPITGCIAYRGYFSLEPARKKARELKDQGYDVQLGGVRAYSTLGWFDDPVLNTFINDDELELAALLFHELAHRQLYFKDDTGFNESFATAISDIGLEQWIALHPQRYNDKSFVNYLNKRKNYKRLTELLRQYRDKLALIYADNALDDDSKRAHKRQFLLALAQDYKALKVQLGTDRYDKWMANMNNAKLANVNNYTGQVADFKKLYALREKDIALFYKDVLSLENLAVDERAQALTDLVSGH